jgi:uncharacterized membrane protein YdjX (TVP38/TMEM64 family)
MAESPPRRPWLRLAALALALAVAFALVAQTGVVTSAGKVRDWVDGLGAVGPLVFVGICAGLTPVFVPVPLLAGAGGLLFGTLLGAPLALAGMLAGACIAFVLGRGGARGSVQQLAARHARVRRIEDFLERRGFVAVLYARLAPLMPFAGVSYAGGATRLAVRPFVLGTAIGFAPRAFADTALGGSLGNTSRPEFWVALGLLVVVGVVGIVLARRTPLDPQGAGRER